ncbi:MAG: glutathione S-transferase, partial [Alphaproteobacteria bacterium]
MLKILGRATSSNVQKVLWCCGELGLAFEREDIGGPFGGNDKPEYLAL